LLLEIVSSSYFYIFYIGLMVAGFIYFYKLIFLPYRTIEPDTLRIKEIITEISEVEDVHSRFNRFNEWIAANADTKYLKKCVKLAWDNYYQKYLQNLRSGVTFTPDVYDFFLEDSFVQKFGNRKLAEIVPGIFLAFGIIGTFLGISAGVSELDPTGDATTMKSGIGILLNGMKVKFLSSIIGISLSLVWQVMDKKWLYPRLSNSFVQIRGFMDNAFPTQEESTVLYQMFKNQEKQMHDFQSFLTEVMIPNMISGFSEALHKTVLPHMEHTQNMMQEMIQRASSTQLEGINQMVDQFVNSLSEITGEHMKGLGEALQATIEWQQKVHSEMSALVESMQESAKGQSEMVEKTTALTEQIHLYTEQIITYQNTLQETLSQINQTTEKNADLQTSISELLDRMVEERNVFHEHFNQHLETLRENVESIVSHSELQAALQSKIEENLQLMSSVTDSQYQLSESLAQQIQLTQGSNDELNSLLRQFSVHGSMFAELQKELIQVLEATNTQRQQMDDTLIKINQNLAEQIEEMDSRVALLKQIWESTSMVLSETNKQLAVSMSRFTEDMHRGLEHTFIQFDQELSKSVQYLASGVEAIQDGISDLPDAIQTLKQSVTELNKYASNMTKQA
jgi:ABC-type transporter Mla subunit MlaD